MFFSFFQIWVYGNSFESFLVAVVNPNKETLEVWAEENEITGDFTSLCENHKAKEFVLGELTKIGKEKKVWDFLAHSFFLMLAGETSIWILEANLRVVFIFSAVEGFRVYQCCTPWSCAIWYGPRSPHTHIQEEEASVAQILSGKNPAARYSVPLICVNSGQIKWHGNWVIQFSQLVFIRFICQQLQYLILVFGCFI